MNTIAERLQRLQAKHRNFVLKAETKARTMSQPKAEEISSAFWRRDAVLEMDLAFCRAVIEAKRAGLEKCKVGVFVDLTPFSPVYFERHQILSAPSIAAQCVEDAPSDGARGKTAMWTR